MKRLRTVTTFLFLSLLLASCKKNYTCTCSYSPIGLASTVPANVGYELGKQTKDKANDLCRSYQLTLTAYSDTGQILPFTIACGVN